MPNVLNGGNPGLLYGQPRSAVLNPGVAENIPHGGMYDLGRAIQKNPLTEFLFGGLGNWLDKTSKEQRTSALENVMAGMDAMPPGLDDMLLKGGAGLAGMTVLHGSPHRFDPEKLVELLTGERAYVGGKFNALKEVPEGAKVIEEFPLGRFSNNAMGTGEGAQAYGWGTYLAENPEVAKQYAQLSTGKLAHKVTGEVVDSRSIPLEKMGEYGAVKPNLYNVDLPDEHIANMLDWDKPLSEQPESVRKALAKLQAGDDPILSELFSDGITSDYLGTFNKSNGGQIYNTLAEQHGGAESLSKKLNSLGIPGIKYLDQGSRASGKGTRNFVVFDDSIVKILSRE